MIYRSSHQLTLASPPSDAPAPIKHHVAGVEGTFLIENVFTPEEMKTFISLGETLGFQADEPIRGDSTAQRDVTGSEVQATGINPRFRSYRYDEGFVYRPHIDGAWPRSGYGPGGQYKYDVDGKETSRLTLVVYLNEGFEGGETKFFLPRVGTGEAAKGDESAEVVVRSVRPSVGACLLFPHGDSRAPLHEGARVDKGCKYILRTEVLYTRPATTGHQCAPEPKKEKEADSKEAPKAKSNKRNGGQDLSQMKKRR